MKLFFRTSKPKVYDGKDLVLERKNVSAGEDRNSFAGNQFKQLVKKNLGVPVTLFHL